MPDVSSSPPGSGANRKPLSHRPFGSTPLRLSPIGIGAAWIGDESIDLSTVRDVLARAVELGINVVDTAPVYGGSEERLGATMGDLRKDLLLFTKCGEVAGTEGEDWSAETIHRVLERSLTRLGTDYVDLLTLHSCELEVLERGEAIAAMQKAKSEGKARYIAYSGDNEALAWSVDSGAFDAVMTSINIADQANRPILQRAREKGLGTLAKRTIANAAWDHQPREDEYGYDYWERLQTLRYPEMDLETAMRFTLSQPVDCAIVGVTSIDELQRDAETAAKGALEDGSEREIRRIWSERAGEDWKGRT